MEIRTITKWRTGGHKDLIEKVDVVRETEKQLVVSELDFRGRRVERRENKESRFHQYHDTWEAAHAYLMDKAQRDVESAQITLERTKGKLGNVKGLKKPLDEAEQ